MLKREWNNLKTGRHRKRWLGAALLLLIAALLTYKVARLWGPVRLLWNEFRTVRPLLSGGGAAQGAMDLETIRELGEDLAPMHQAVTQLEEELRPLLNLTPHLGWVPRYGGDLKNAPHLVTLGREMLALGEAVYAGLSPLLDSLDEGQGSPTERALPVLIAARPHLLEAQEHLEAVVTVRERIDDSIVSPRLQVWLTRLDQALPLLDVALTAALDSPQLLGADRPRSYLILAQNEDELRATGGFISGVGVLTLDKGAIKEMSFRDSYTVDDFSKPYPDAPSALFRTMLAELLVFRDSNWWPDFPTSAQKAAELYAYGTGRKVDGVIAVDQEAARLLLRAVEPVQVKGFDQPITSRNIKELMRQFWNRPREAKPGQTGKWWVHRKDFMGELAAAALAKVEGGLEGLNLKAAVQAVLTGLNEKHFLLWLPDTEVQQALARYGWDGSLRPVEGDYLMVVDSNVGFNKVSANVETRQSYRVTLSTTGSAQAELTLYYRNRSHIELEQCIQGWPYDRPYGQVSYEELMNHCYWDYLRVYVPLGSRLLSATSNPLPPGSLWAKKYGGAGRDTTLIESQPNSSDKEVLATFFVVPPQEEHRQKFVYTLPGDLVRQEGDIYTYTLFVQKQPGVKALPLEVTVVLPPGARVVATEPPPATAESNTLTFRLTMNTDQQVTVQFDISP